MPLQQPRESPELKRKASANSPDVGYFPGENMIQNKGKGPQPWPLNTVVGQNVADPDKIVAPNLTPPLPPTTTSTTTSPATTSSSTTTSTSTSPATTSGGAVVPENNQMMMMRGGGNQGGNKNDMQAVSTENISGRSAAALNSIPKPSDFFNMSLTSSMDFRKAGLDIETIGEYLAIQASESRARALLIMDKAALTYDSHLKKMGKLHFEAFEQLENLSKTLAHQGRKLYLKGYEGSSGSSLRLNLKNAAAAAAAAAAPGVGSNPDASTTTMPVSSGSGSGSGSGYNSNINNNNLNINNNNNNNNNNSSFLSKSPSYYNPTSSMFLFKPDFLTKPVISEQHILAAGQDVERIGEFIAAEALRYKTQTEIDIRKAKDMREKQAAANSKLEGKLSEGFEKCARKIVKTGRAIQNIRIVKQ